MRCTVYGLYSTRDRVTRYVGQTKKLSPDQRFRSHLGDARRASALTGHWTKLTTWIIREWDAGFEVKVRTITQDGTWNVSEKSVIAGLIARDVDLMNVQAGGNWGNHDPQVVARSIGHTSSLRPKPQYPAALKPLTSPRHVF